MPEMYTAELAPERVCVDCCQPEAHIVKFYRISQETLPEVPSMETAYLKKCFGNSLTKALAEVARVRPSDPIEYLAHWLYHYRDVTNAKEKKKQEELQLKEEYDRSLQEVKMNEMKKQEEYQTQQKCEKCHEDLLPEAVSPNKTSTLQKDTALLEKETTRQKSPPGVSSVVAETPQRDFTS